MKERAINTLTTSDEIITLSELRIGSVFRFTGDKECHPQLIWIKTEDAKIVNLANGSSFPISYDIMDIRFVEIIDEVTIKRNIS